MFDEKKLTPEEIAKKTLEDLKAKKTLEDLKAKKTKPADKGDENKGDESQNTPTATPTENKNTVKNEDESQNTPTATPTEEEEQKQADEKLLNMSDEDAENLSDDDKVKRQDLKKKTGYQKRIDELVRQREEEKERNAANERRIAELEARIEDITQNTAPSEQVRIAEAEEQRITSYLAEDASKPLSEKREMSDDELTAWSLEDNVAATEWVTRRTIRRIEERENDKRLIAREKAAADLSRAQKPYIEQTLKDHPELDTHSRTAELQAEGKSSKEIFDTLCKENKKYAVVQEILNENPRYYGMPDGPVLVVKEMEKRLGIKKGGETDEEREERIRQEAAEAERQRLAAVDNADGSSRNQPKKTEHKKTELEEEQEAIIKASGLDMERVKKRIAKRKELGL